MTDPKGYKWLKKENDPRWTNAKKRDALKAVAENAVRAAEVSAESRRLEDAEVARRLAETKRSTAAVGDAVKRVVARRNMDHVLSVVPAPVDRVAYERMGSAAAVERSMWLKLECVQQRLDDCRHRVAEKESRLGRLHAIAAERARPAAEAPPVAVHVPPLVSPVVLEKTTDALKLAGRQLTRVRDLIADNLAMRSALRDQLAEDVRQQAANVAKLIAYRAVAHGEVAAFERLYCRAVDDHGRVARRNATAKRMINEKAADLEVQRKRMIANRRQEDSENNNGFIHDSESLAQDLDSNSLSSYRSVTSAVSAQKIPLMDWIQNGLMHKQMYRQKKEVLKRDTADMSLLMTDYDDYSLSSSSDDFTYPVEKINLFKSGNGEDRTAVTEAVEYVCDTLGFDDAEEVLRFFTTVKHLELRIKKMIAVRKHLFGVAQGTLESTAAKKADALNCVPGSILRLDANTKRVIAEGLDVQQKQLDEVNENIEKYARAFNELWFYLENVTKKLQRCQNPVVRKYQLYKEKQKTCTEWTMDAHRMLEGLCPGRSPHGDENDGSSAARREARPLPPPPRGPAPKESGPSEHSGAATVTPTFDWNPAAVACRELAAKFHSKVKACMVHIGGDFDADDDSQLFARAYFAYNRQYQWQQARAGAQRSLTAVAVTDPAADDGKDAAGLMTREQTKRRADDIVQWFLTPKDTDDAKRTRKPISFRKSRIVLKPPPPPR